MTHNRSYETFEEFIEGRDQGAGSWDTQAMREAFEAGIKEGERRAKRDPRDGTDWAHVG